MTSETLLSWAARVCACPTDFNNDIDNEFRSRLSNVRERLYAGPDQKQLQQASRRGGKRITKDQWENRSCSPLLFERNNNTVMVKNNDGANTTTTTLTTTTMMPGEEPHKRLEPMLLNVASTFYDPKIETALDQVNLQGLTRPHKATSLGSLLLPIRRRNILDEWSPKEIAIFESAICLYGKEFDTIAQLLSNKTTQEVVEFYYFWKNTSHHAPWKKTFKAVDLGDSAT
jgi:hypothetical protein